MVEKLKLKEHQIDHYNRVKKILSYSHCMIDCSPMGAGKTYVTINYALEHDLQILAFCEATIQNKIERCCKLYGVKEFEAMTYNMLRGTSKKKEEIINVNHNYLVAKKYRGKKGGLHFKYKATEELINLVKKGVLIVFDEFQALKNKSLQYYAALEIARTVARYRGNSNSRVLYLSETGIDDSKFIENVVTLLCMTNYDYLIKGNCSDGYQEIIQLALSIDSDVAKKYISSHVDSNNVITVVYNLYINLFKHYYSSSMPKLDINCHKDQNNCFYKVSNEEAENISREIKEIQNNITFLSNGSAVFNGGNRGKNIGNLLMDIEFAKVSLFERLIRETLKERDNCKVILSLNYINTINKLISNLEDLNYLVITGETPTKRNNKIQGECKPKLRHEIIESFQNDDNCRVLILSRVGRAGIDLDDQKGDRPRVLFISPTYSYINVKQMTGRVYRDETKSDVIIRVVYAYNKKYQKYMNQEMKIIQALHRKDKVTKEMSNLENDNDDDIFSDKCIYEKGIKIPEGNYLFQHF